ncbi:uncharacterized protein [Venturia canescens]|uniref:uncharacterized protein isoform X2 n=1 Tax=Venturia canescens TaxID=32260 RepID=UPI001C9CFF47|nr:uncharacterized protein LOC122410519 isoform X2 [Venturia canescens]
MSAKRFEKRTKELLHEVSQKIAEKINRVYGLNIKIFNNTVTENLVEDSKSLRDIIHSLQDKFNNADTIGEKVQLLSILPQAWEFKDVKKYFNCTNYIFREYRKSKQTHGDSTVRKRKKYWKVSNAMRETITNYYLDERNCYICPGIKQYKRKRCHNSGQEELVQKKMLLYTLRDLYQNFINDYSGTT